jgi:hypothetical protein
MKHLYARFVLWLLRPALEIAGWTHINWATQVRLGQQVVSSSNK